MARSVRSTRKPVTYFDKELSEESENADSDDSSFHFTDEPDISWHAPETTRRKKLTSGAGDTKMKRSATANARAPNRSAANKGTGKINVIDSIENVVCNGTSENDTDSTKNEKPYAVARRNKALNTDTSKRAKGGGNQHNVIIKARVNVDQNDDEFGSDIEVQNLDIITIELDDTPTNDGPIDSDASDFIFTDTMKEVTHSRNSTQVAKKSQAASSAATKSGTKRKRKSISASGLKKRQKLEGNNTSEVVKQETLRNVKAEPKITVKKEVKTEDGRKVRVKKESAVHMDQEAMNEESAFPEYEEPGYMEQENFVPSEVKMEAGFVKTEGQTERSGYKLGGIEWESSMVANYMDMDFWLAKSVISLFKKECTIPFIARYRRECTRNMDADTLRQVKDTYEHIKTLESKAETVRKQIAKSGKLTKTIDTSIQYVKSIEELEDIYAPFKPGSSKSKAERARALGLDEAAQIVLNGTSQFKPRDYLDSSKDGLKTTDDVIQNVQNIMADVFAKDETILEYIHRVENIVQITIKSSKINRKKANAEHSRNTNENAEDKLRHYFDFQCDTKSIKPHQILALNRGEHQKILSVKTEIAPSFFQALYKLCNTKWLEHGINYPLRYQMFSNSFKDSYNRLISPLLSRRVKSKLTRKAEQAAIETFATNLKNLLRTSPIKGCSILGIDPGIKHGVKFALISGTGDVLWTSVLNFDLYRENEYRNENYMQLIKGEMVQHRCELIALGNGKGCREVEQIISDYVKDGFFNPELNVQYTVVNERSASIYSCSPIAKEEFPDLDTNLISAVFIARCLQDPLSEFVKVEPKHLGVGMYQHDMPEKQLNLALDETIMECVSFAGVDVNTASQYLLKRVSGLNNSRAMSIIEWRRQNGPFRNREQLRLVKGIGPKSFEQCSGFIRIHPKTANVKTEDRLPEKSAISNKKNNHINPLDSTWIHPESYATAQLFMNECCVMLNDLGMPHFISKVKNVINSRGLKNIAAKLNISEESISLIADALTKPSDYDYRLQFNKPVFQKAITSIDNLEKGMTLTGSVNNVTQFGAFVDIGVGRNGLLHWTNLNGKTVKIGDRVEVEIINLELERGRIGLYLVRIL